MSHPVFQQLPAEYHDRVILTRNGQDATIDVQADDTKTVPVITDWDRDRMRLPRSGHPDRRNSPVYPTDPRS